MQRLCVDDTAWVAVRFKMIVEHRCQDNSGMFPRNGEGELWCSCLRSTG